MHDHYLQNRRSFLAATASAMIALLAPNVRAETPAGWKIFRGNFFNIGVPPGYVATPQGQPGGGGKSDEVSLWNESLKVEFCVFSPQWNGKAIMSEVGDRAEVLSEHESKKIGDVQEEQWTITARDKSYVRFVVSRTKLKENTNTTFGIRVPNMKVYEQVKPVYLRWKQTLQQFAD